MNDASESRLYSFVGPSRLLQLSPSPRRAIREAKDVIVWMEGSHSEHDSAGRHPATFVVDEDGLLWIADRHSEHVSCARGRAVASAGEIFFLIEGGEVMVDEVTNQSTGYCPEPESWAAVEQALQAARIPHPGEFTTSFHFRRCCRCNQRNLVKDEIFECAVCGARLSREWNFDAPSP